MGTRQSFWSNSTGRFSDLLCKMWRSFFHSSWLKHFSSTFLLQQRVFCGAFCADPTKPSAQVPVTATLAFSSSHALPAELEEQLYTLLCALCSLDHQWTSSDSWKKKKLQNSHGNSRPFFSTNFGLLQGDLWGYTFSTLVSLLLEEGGSSFYPKIKRGSLKNRWNRQEAPCDKLVKTKRRAAVTFS